MMMTTMMMFETMVSGTNSSILRDLPADRPTSQSVF